MVLKYLKFYSNISTDVMLMLLGSYTIISHYILLLFELTHFLSHVYTIMDLISLYVCTCNGCFFIILMDLTVK